MSADSSSGTQEPIAKLPSGEIETDRRSLGKYQLIRKIGAGGMGTVFLALDSQLKRTVALKILPRERTSNPTLVKRFQAEAQAAAQLKHDNIVTVYDAGNADGHLYIALEYVEGTDVHELVARNGRIPLMRSIEIIKQVARALDHAHKQGIVHRDIKPSNLLLMKDGTVKLTDMGLARSIDETVDTGITREGTTVGTVDYMSPEQARDSQAADIRSDIYSLGCTWYQMLTGSPPFPTGSVTNKLYAHVSKPRPDPRSVNPKIPEGAVEILHKMMARKASERYQTPAELLKDLENVDLRMSREQTMVLDAITDTSEVDDVPKLASSLPPPMGDSGRLKGDSGRLKGDSGRLKGDSGRLKGDSGKLKGDSGRLAEETGRTADDSVRFPSLPPRMANPSLPSSEQSSRRDRRELPPRADDSSARTARPEGKKNKGVGGSARNARPQVSEEPVISRKPAASRQKSSSGTWSVNSIDYKQLAWVGGIIFGVVLLGVLFMSIGSGVDPSDVPKNVEGVEGNGAQNAANPVVPPPRSRRREEQAPPAKEEKKEDAPPENSQAAVLTDGANNAAAGAGKAEQIPIGRQGEKELTPDWVAQVWNASLKEASEKFPTFRVGRTTGPPSKFASLNDALENLPDAGGVVELVGDGPFLLTGERLETHGRVVIAAAQESRPVVLLAPNFENAAVGALTLAGGTLELRGIHFTAVAGQYAGDAPRKLVVVEGGDLVVRDCSVTMQGERTSPLVAFRVSGRMPEEAEHPRGEPHALLHNVFVRGGNLTALEFNLPAVDALISNSFLGSGEAPALRVTSTSDAVAATQEPANGNRPQSIAPPQGLTARNAPSPVKIGTDSAGLARRIRLFSSMICGGRNAFELVPGSDVMNPPTTEMRLLNSIVACETSVRDSQLLYLRDWQEDSSEGNRGSMLKNLDWSMEHSLVLGWKVLLQKDLGIHRIASDPKIWEEFWKKPVDTLQFQRLPWPGREFGDWAAITPASLAVTNPGTEGIKATDGERPGCDSAKFATPEPAILAYAAALVERPVLPAGFLGEFAATKVRNVNLDSSRTSDLGRVIASTDWQDGAVFHVSGSGIKTSSPIRVEGKSLRIEFDDSSRGNLTIQAVPESSKESADAFLSVSKGNLELVGVNLKMQNSARRTEPQWLVSVADGNLSIRNSLLIGQVLDSPGNAGLVKWSETSAGLSGNAPAQPAGHYQHYLHVSTSSLTARDSLFTINAPRGGLIVDNTLCASGNRGFDLLMGDGPSGGPQAVDIYGCTLSAAGELFHCRGRTRETQARPVLQIFVRETAVVPPPSNNKGSAEPPALLVCDGFQPTDGQLGWWEQSSGYTPQLGMFFRQGPLPEGTKPSVQSAGRAEWNSFWGPGHIHRSLLDEDGVLLTESKRQTLADLNADDFRLLANTKATEWTVDGRSIGVDLDALPPLAFKGGLPPAKSTKKEKEKPPKQRSTGGF